MVQNHKTVIWNFDAFSNPPDGYLLAFQAATGLWIPVNVPLGVNRFLSPIDGYVTTTVAALSNGATLPTGTINVASVSGFQSAGSFFIQSSSGLQVINYTGTQTSPVAFTGCTGGAGTLATGNSVIAIYTIQTTDDFLRCDSSADPLTVYLPTVPISGKGYTIADVTGHANANNVTVVAQGGFLISGNPNFTITSNFQTLTVVFNGIGWSIV
jgi:hypothetical protein